MCVLDEAGEGNWKGWGGWGGVATCKRARWRQGVKGGAAACKMVRGWVGDCGWMC